MTSHSKNNLPKRVALGVLVLAALFVCAIYLGSNSATTYRAQGASSALADAAQAPEGQVTVSTGSTAIAPAAAAASPEVAASATALGAEALPFAQLVSSTTATASPIVPPTVHQTSPLTSAGEASVIVGHQPTPSVVRAAYMTACVASGSDLRQHVLDVIAKTNLNAIVIDVKDYTGYLSYNFGDDRYPSGGTHCQIRDLKQFLAALKEKGIYRIARVAVMQDPEYARTHPSEAVQRKDGGGVWHDKKGLAFVDPGSKDFWKYVRDAAYHAYDVGFDEVNFDYVRFPTDGDLANMSFTHTGKMTKAAMMKQFFEYMGKSMRDRKIPSSIDVFGMTTTAKDDLGIGQVLENVIPNFDYVAPMVYPSHYPKGFNKWKDPNLVPGPLTVFVMNAAVERAKAIGFGANKFRTWIQDFNYGKVYTLSDVRAEIAGSVKVGVTSYMAWDPNNRYTTAAYIN